jgi:uncharacterized membrane protein
MRNKKLMIIPMLLVCTLALIGFVYAHWSKTLYINGNVETGNFSVGFTPTLIISDNEFEKDVGTVTASLIDLDGDGVYDKIEVTIGNAYPCYEAYIDCYIKNYGTIPVKIQSIIVNAPSQLTVEINWFIYPSMQIDPGDEVMAEIYVHVLQEASQGSTYTFTGTINAIQWNEYAS